MSATPTPHDEAARIRSLRSLRMLETLPEDRFDRYTRIAQRVFGVPIALVTLVDRDRVWFKSRQGLDVEEQARDGAFCGHTILSDGLLVVPDATRDPRFSKAPLVAGNPQVRFYAGHPLVAPGGRRLGTLCIMDTQPRELADADRLVLADLAAMVTAEFVPAASEAVDALTGLPNRRGFQAIAAQTLAMCERSRAPSSLLMVKLHGVREITAERGQEEGDEIVREASELLKFAFRQSDVIGRLEDDAFGVLLSGAGVDQARLCLKRLREHVRERNAIAGGRHKLDYDAGLAECLHGSGEPLAQLIVRAETSRLEHNSRDGAA